MLLAKAGAALVAGAALFLSAAQAADYLVRSQAEYRKAVRGAAPGDSIILADGDWRDFDIVFEARGEADAPIELRGQTPGGVAITGRSSLRIAGEHLVVRDLIFRDGFSPRSEVIAFRKDSKSVANNSRLANVVIDGFSKPEREEDDNWVVLFGKGNTVEHNYFAGKTNRGPTLVVRLDGPGNVENGHRIAYNHFGLRPPLGGNGGETIRIGVSQTSRQQSNTLVTRNFFERCDGEVEIISVKSEGNEISENVFFESRGSVVLRHGGGNLIARNVFFGNGVADTGGIRVINENQTVRGNYLEGLRGAKFLSAIAVMNGVPNSPENRYHQVKDAVIENNSFIDVSVLGFAVGADQERSAPPQNSVFRENLLVIEGQEPAAAFDDVSGIAFEGNVGSNPALADFGAAVRPSLTLKRAENGLLYPEDKELASVGAPRNLSPVRREETGPSWFEKPALDPRSETRRIEADGDALRRAIEEAQAGETFELAAGLYEIDMPIAIDRPVTIKGAGADTVLRSGAPELFELRAGGALSLSDLRVELRAGANTVFAASGEAYKGAYSLLLDAVELDAAEAGGATFLKAAFATFASSVTLNDVSAKGFSGGFITLAATSDEGWFLADEVAIRGSEFADITGPLVAYGRLGGDESTFGPRFIMTGSTLNNVGGEGASLNLAGVDAVELSGNRFENSGAALVRQRVAGGPFSVSDNVLVNTPPIEAHAYGEAEKGDVQ